MRETSGVCVCECGENNQIVRIDVLRLLCGELVAFVNQITLDIIIDIITDIIKYNTNLLTWN